MSDNEIITESPLQRIWLTLFRGYKVQLIKNRPKQGMGGSIRYKTQWVMQKRRPKPE